MTVWISVFAKEENDTSIPHGNGSYVDFEAFFMGLHVKTLQYENLADFQPKHQTEYLVPSPVPG